jgi:hypothetical protein
MYKEYNNYPFLRYHESFDNRFTSQVYFNFNCDLNKEEGNYIYDESLKPSNEKALI